jgi:hypothetical protein
MRPSCRQNAIHHSWPWTKRWRRSQKLAPRQAKVVRATLFRRVQRGGNRGSSGGFYTNREARLGSRKILADA